MPKKIAVSCNNIFKNKEKALIEKAYTKKWIEIIKNQITFPFDK